MISILDQLDLCLCILAWVAVGAVRAVCKGMDGTVIFIPPALDVVSADFVADTRQCDTFCEGTLNYCLLNILFIVIEGHLPFGFVSITQP